MYRIHLTEEQLKATHKTMAFLAKWGVLSSPTAREVWYSVQAAHKRMLKGEK